ncbi:MAG: 50S ribosome-binding GTPase, partial [Anaerolineales bacterium]|nr:50S ribosome-binding GTPase [Anaerolineales bacterium]
GTTRDRLFGEAEWNGRAFHVVDTGGIDPTHGGRTPLSIGSADFIEEIKAQAQVAISEADAILFVTDGEAGVTAPDLEVADILRRSQKKLEDGSFYPPIFVVVNKCESKERRDNATQFYEL